MLDAKEKAGRASCGRAEFAIRSRLYGGLCDGTMNIRSLYEDEKEKLHSDTCCYCGSREALTLDHLVPRAAGGGDTGDNLVYSCQSCNSSKGKKDLLVWYLEKRQLPPIPVLRRYMKLAYRALEQSGGLDLPLSEMATVSAPYRLDLIPEIFEIVKSV